MRATSANTARAHNGRETHRGHAFTVDRCGRFERNIRVPSLGIDLVVWATYREALGEVRRLIDEHLAEHGDAPVERKPMTDEERAELYRETFGRF
jgi:hypothetical protein